MEISPAELAADLRRLRRGRGVQAVRLGDEVGPALRALCGVEETDPHAAVREKVRATLRDSSEGLPFDLRAVFVGALALDVDVAGKFLGDRERSLADEFHRDVRTIRRRVEEAIDLFAENAVARSGPPPGGEDGDWHVERLEALVRLDVPEPECVERRTIVAEGDIGDHVRVAATPPAFGPAGDGADLRAVSLFGAEVIGEQRVRDGRLLLDLRLPQPLCAGQRHECGLVVRACGAGGIRSHYLYRPERRCESFELRVRFPVEHVPTSVSLVRGAADHPEVVGDEVAVDAVHEVRVTFADLRSGFAYGIRWRPVARGA